MTPFTPIRCALGEGPLWHPLRETLYWFDILHGRLHSAAQSWTFPEMVSACAWVDETRLLIASETRLFLFDLDSGLETPLCALEDDKTTTRSNDGRADPQGGFWIGTMGKNAEPRAGAIWRWYRGALRKLYSGITIPNAMSFAPDGRSACFTDTVTGLLMRVSLDAEGWPQGQPTPWLDLRGTGENPDGAVFDVDGRLWLALWGAGAVAAYAPDGTEVARLHMSAAHSSCPAFGGADFRTLYCTTAQQGITSPGPLDGAVFAGPAPATGLPERRVILPDG